MVKRKRLGIRFDIPYKAATGAVIYFMNIINALNVLPDDERPEVLAFVSPDGPKEFLEKIDYPYLKIVPVQYLPFWKRAVNRAYRTVTNGKKFNLFNARTYRGEPLNGMLSLVIPSEDINTKRQLLWLADLQTHHLPDNYTQHEIDLTHGQQKKIIKGGHDIVMCSQWCVDDFNRLYPDHKSRVHRLRFATFHEDYSDLKIENIKAKYKIEHDYFIVSNQFWIHKNHIAVLRAIKMLKKDYPHLQCIITGNPKVNSAKSKNYVEGLNTYINENELSDNVHFLGLIPRNEQLCLMKNSIAIIQPSFFESWNTTVEDSKAMGKLIILSDLAVHKEQISENVLFFDPDNAGELAEQMRTAIESPPAIIPYDYSKNVEAFARDILKMLA